MKKRKILYIFILIIIFMFTFKIDVKADTYECNYTNSENEKLEITVNFDNYLSSTVKSGMKLSDNTKFYPLQALYYYSNDEPFYLNDDNYLFYHYNGNGIPACPKTISVYNKDIEVLLDYDTGQSQKQKIIVFSKEGISLDSNFESIDIVLNRDIQQEVEGIISRLQRPIIYTYNSGNNAYENNIDENNYMECTYKKRNDENEYKFKFQKQNGIGYFYENNTWKEIEYEFIANDFKIDSCPQVVFYSGKKFRTVEPTDCDSDSNCYFRELDSDYFLNQKHYNYILYGSNTNNKIRIQVGQNTNGSIDVKIVADGSLDKSEITISNLDSYIDLFKARVAASDERIPRYIIKPKGTESYIFVESMQREDGSVIETDEIYINKESISPNGTGLGDEELYKTCKQLFGESFLQFLYDKVFKIIWIGIPLLLILLTSYDFAKVVFNDDKDGMQSAFKRFGRRAVAAILIFLTPYIIILIANIIGAGETIESCAKTLREMGKTVMIYNEKKY